MQTHNFESTAFGGPDYDPARDMARMADGLAAVFAVMKDTPTVWYTLEQIAELSGVPQSSVGSYLCYLRRDFGYKVPKEYVRDGLYVYCLGLRGEPQGKKQKRGKNPDNEAALQMCQMLWDALRFQPDGGAKIELMPLDLALVENLASRAGIKKPSTPTQKL